MVIDEHFSNEEEKCRVGTYHESFHLCFSEAPQMDTS